MLLVPKLTQLTSLLDDRVAVAWTMASTDTQVAADIRNESTSLLAGRTRAGYRSIARGEERSRASAPLYGRASVKVAFATGVLLFAINLFAFLFLATLLYHPHLTSPFATSPLLQADLHFLAAATILPSLLLFELTSSSNRRAHLSSLVLLVAILLLLVVVPELRVNGTAAGTAPAAICLALALVWNMSCAKLIESLQADAPDTSDRSSVTISPHARVAAISQEDSNNKVASIRAFLARFPPLLVPILLFVLAANVALDAYTLSATIPGRKVWIDVARDGLSSLQLPRAIDVSMSRSVRPFRLHVGIESSPLPPDLSTSKSGNGSSPYENKPTAVFFPPLTSVPGYAASRWVQAMVHRAAHEPNGNGTKDGHLALRRAFWYDAPGTGFSDYIRNAENLDLQALTVISALQQVGLLKGKSTSDPELSPEDQFTLIGLSSGSLVANVFASYLPDYVHSQILIDAETVESFYGDAISPESDLRIGHGAAGSRSVGGRVWSDLLPAMWSPFGACRLLAALLGEIPDATLGDLVDEDDGRSSSRWSPQGVLSTFCSPDSLASGTSLLVRLSHNIDSSLGPSSRNAQRLRADNVEAARRQLLASRPTGVLTSFWKLMRDPQGWGNVQKESIVKYALEGGARKGNSSGSDEQQSERQGSHLVGWWRVGPKEKSGPETLQGICGQRGSRGRVWCEEAVRKILAWDSATHGAVSLLDPSSFG
ncbi:unnamed protein product [Parajaminaea phylloscopi]